jgi:hypothetical protein
LPVPAVGKMSKKVEPAAFKAILDDDVRTLGAFVQKWRPKVDAMTHARHRTMLSVMLGEALEHQRLFTQAAAGFEDPPRQAHWWRRPCGRRPARALAGVAPGRGTCAPPSRSEAISATARPCWRAPPPRCAASFPI